MTGDDVLRTVVGPVREFDRRDLAAHPARAATALLGALLVRDDPTAASGVVLARIVETEAYREDEAASHSHRGRTARTEPMFRRPGTAYVYRSYGVHWCCNVAAEADGLGSAVLLRAAVVLDGSAAVAARRPTARHPEQLLRGPGNLAAGLDIDGPRHDRGDLVAGVAGVRLAQDDWRPQPTRVVCGPRVGVSAASELPWRRFLADVPEVSAYRRSPRAAPAR